eukprot:GILI01027768.1.p1 GENE.GILI01027768.1~~GILI01027768.1.p1  ORF type:complete len:321 (+),score=18.80 GILI01027768.1:22-984(+)
MDAKATLDLVDASALGQDYLVESKLGEGTYGVVYKATSRHTGASVAIKKLRLEGLAEGVPATAIREITLLQDLSNHPNIVHLLQVICRKHRLYLIFELMNEDLRIFTIGYVRRNRQVVPPPSSPAVPAVLAKQFTRQILHALWTCHENRIIHRDLKPGNILVGERSGQYFVKLADFGLARTFELPLCTYTHEVVTLWYRAPEILLGEKHYTPAVDVWSVGCIVFEMLTGLPLLRGESHIDQLQKTFALIGTPTEDTWPGASHYLKALPSIPSYPRKDWTASLLAFLDPMGRSFVQTLLTLDPKSRPTVSDALSHPWLASD